jgi:peptidoglycan/xylan/chitin deacetylase (PgdA/CDA1 family)
MLPVKQLKDIRLPMDGPGKTQALSFDVPILMYHGVFKAGEQVKPYGIGVQQLEQQLRLLQKLKYQTVTVGELLKVVLRQAPKRGKMAVLTFDDGDITFAESALPLLRQFGMTATIFLVSGWLGQPGHMDASTVKDAMKAGIEVGGHSMNHPSLCGCSDAELHEELVVAKEKLESSVGTSLQSFCYPYGHHHPRLYPLLAMAGYLGAVSVFSREPTVTHNPFAMRRVHPHPGDGPFRFRLKLSPLYLKWVAHRDRNRKTDG